MAEIIKLPMDSLSVSGGMHVNYVIGFDDGSVKVGVTGRPHLRIAEVISSKTKTCDAKPTRCILSPPSHRDQAYKTEKNICSLLRYMAQSGRREWFRNVLSGTDLFHYLQQTTGMFWCMNANGKFLDGMVEVQL